MNIHTKIICTIGPKVNSFKKIVELIQAGMNVARINFSHGDEAQHLEIINYLKKAREQCKKPLSIMLDTKGPEIRVKNLLNKKISLKKGSQIKIVKKISNKKDEIEIVPYSITKFLKLKMRVLFADGAVICKVIKKTNNYVLLEAKNEGEIKIGNKLNFPESSLDLPFMTKKDIKDLTFGCLHDIDIVAASFVRSAEQVLEIKKMLYELNKPEILVVAKIENKEGLKNFESILEVADGIMIARGDLGVEIDLSLVPKYQKMMIKKCYLNFKPVVTATQMLESMIANPRPTRAEVSDVANAIYDATSSVMLSAETAIGLYPIEVIKQMKSIIKEAENDFNNEQFFHLYSTQKTSSVSSAVSIAAVKTAYSANAKAFFIYTSSGYTARLVSSWRPKMPIIALTTNLKTYHQLAFLWGVVPLYVKECRDAQHAFDIMSQYALENKVADFGDLIIVTTGVSFGRKGSTNMMMLDSIGHIIVRGIKGYGKKTAGKIKIIRVANIKDIKKCIGKILVIPRCDASYLPVISKAKGLILQNISEDALSEKNAVAYAEKLKIPLIVQAENAMTLLSDEEKVILDPQKKLVYYSDLR